MEEMFFCPSCMAKAAPVDGKCPVCGHDVNIENAPHQLPVNTILNGRYIIGRVLGAGGFGITYIGYDLKLDGKVAVKGILSQRCRQPEFITDRIPDDGGKGQSL